MQPANKNWLKDNWINLSILTLLIAVTFANALNNVFLSDDLAEIVQNPNVGKFSYIFTHPFGFIRILLNYFAYHLGGLNPAVFRLINYGFHLGSVLLIYTILTILINRRLAIIAAAFFAIHPAISEAVVWISGGTYPQYTFFFLLSFLFYILSSKSRLFYLLSSIFYLLSFMSHPVMPVTLFMIFLIYELCFGDIKKNWVRSIPYFLIAIAYILVNLSALPERTTTLQSVHYQEKGIDNPFVLIPVAISSYLELIFFPKDLTLYHSELAFSKIQFLIRAGVTLLFLTFTIISFKKNKNIFFWLSLFWLSLAPTLTPFRLNWIVAERYLYLPSLGIFASLALLLHNLSQKKQYKYALYGLVIIAVAILSARTIIRNIDWKNEDNLWIATGKTSPSSPNTHNNLGDVYGRWGDKQRALQEFQTAISLKPNYADAYHNLANTYRELNQLDLALENYQKAIEFNPNLWQSYQNIAALYFQNKQYDKALEYIQKAIQVNPKNINLYNNLGIVYLVSGDKEKAKQIFNQILSADPQNQIARQGLIEASN
ncbi:tetratricopeptide repeat protein [Candidatus Daviesbacteria bacterium]|nr:tetratricopeptide repeat protein [Candidatus Daviesbacteria bacterium]